MRRFPIPIVILAGFAGMASANASDHRLTMAQNVDVRALEPPTDVRDKQLKAQEVPGDTGQGRSVERDKVPGTSDRESTRK